MVIRWIGEISLEYVENHLQWYGAEGEEKKTTDSMGKLREKSTEQKLSTELPAGKLRQTNKGWRKIFPIPYLTSHLFIFVGDIVLRFRGYYPFFSFFNVSQSNVVFFPRERLKDLLYRVQGIYIRYRHEDLLRILNFPKLVYLHQFGRTILFSDNTANILHPLYPRTPKEETQCTRHQKIKTMLEKSRFVLSWIGT